MSKNKKSHQTKKNKETLILKEKNDFNLKRLLKEELFYFKLLLFIFPFFYGLFYTFTSSFAGAILCLYLTFLMIKRKKIYFAKNSTVILLSFVFISYLIVSLWAVDKGMAFIGFLKFSPCLIFLIILMQFKKTEIRDCFNVIAYSGVVMVIITAPTLMIPQWSEYFYDTHRLGGFFQYANSFSLYLLIGLVIIAKKNQKTGFNRFSLVILFCGILLSGSRSGFILMLILYACFLLLYKNLRRDLIIFGITLLSITCIYSLSTGNFENIGRFMTISLGSSTFLGRLLYAIDALNLLIQNPFGIGYMGYYYLQPQIQTGVYSVKFVHDELLQMGLDAGIFSALAFIFVWIRSFFSKNSFIFEKLILALIFIHVLFDFDLQFISIFFVVLMSFDLGESELLENKWIKKGGMFLSILGFMGYLYCSLALYAVHLGDEDLGLKLLPQNTEAKIQALQEARSLKEMEYWGDSVLSGNKTISLAYEAKAAVAASKNDFENSVKNQEKAIDTAKYEIKKYEQLLILLEKLMIVYNEAGDKENLMRYAKIALDLPNRLEAIKESSHPLAFKIDDPPVLEFSENDKEYLKNLEKAVSEN